jgi:CheY-like chemotaxis protein
MTDSKASSSGPPANTILFVEDEVIIRMTISQYLRECGYRVVEAANADEALQVLQSNITIDVVFTDVGMPGSMDGFGLAKWVRENRKGLDVVLAGSPTRAANAAAGLCESGPMLEKPYEPQLVVDTIRRLIGLRQSQA